MLRNLHIKNLALIREIDVDFGEGLNILTGETGAGKSIIVGSVMTALGAKFSRSMLREGAPSALVEMVFETENPSVLKKLAELGIEPEDGVILISRKLEEGKSVCRINGVTSTTAQVRECGACLIDIHGQHEYQQLLRNDRQLELLDEFGGEAVSSAKARTAEDYRTYSSLKKRMSETGMSEEERLRTLSFLDFEIQEIEEADLQPGEDEELEKLYRRLSNSKRIAETVNAVHTMTGYDSDEGAGETIGRALKELESVSEFDPALEELENSLRSMDSLLNDFNRDTADYISGLTYEADSFEETEERLNRINRLKAKYADSIEGILNLLEEKKKKRSELEDYAEGRKHLESEFHAAEAALKKSSDALTAVRKETAASFEKAAQQQFLDLNFARADFEIGFSVGGNFSANGQDTVDFLIRTNPGEPKLPINKIASGGELSRIMLGIRTMFAAKDDTDTLIFDEIDAGISGRTAQKVAEKLSVVSRSHQTLCITHLPQIAAMADEHYAITKEVSETEAVTRIDALSEEESVRELARILGGAKLTESTFDTAREMKEMCRQYKSDAL
ncbi:MAG: DNA repair protein RecN [Lachnospiraceae bacterium]|jgi:DNA repair protein RecN (Recombination protein N)|nr:DNA repair protein RecN [Lachnospiraceae bacterium]MCI1726852.1 DNA repair protein RecN [Lachnospiraceae bacterium]